MYVIGLGLATVCNCNQAPQIINSKMNCFGRFLVFSILSDLILAISSPVLGFLGLFSIIPLSLTLTGLCFGLSGCILVPWVIYAVATQGKGIKTAKDICLLATGATH